MIDDSFWSVDLGVGMGPLLLGSPKSDMLRVLHQHLKGEIADRQAEEEIEDDGDEVYISMIETNLIFSSEPSQQLRRIEVDDERLRFGNMEVIGKPIHEIVNLFNVPTSETLWCDFFEDDEQAKAASKTPKYKSDRELLNLDTLWITSLGLGLSVYRGMIVAVNLCSPDDVPRYGSGTWSDSQRELSENGFPTSPSATASKEPSKDPLIVRILFYCMIAVVGIVIWQAVDMQLTWNRQPDTPAKIVSVDPPPPQPFPERYNVTYKDSEGGEHQATFLSKDIYGLPEIGTDINIRFLPTAPETPLTLHNYENVGVDYAIPRCIGIGAVYLVVRILSLFPFFRRSSKTLAA